MRRFGLGFLVLVCVAIAVVAPLPWVLGLIDGVPDQAPLLEHLVERNTAERFAFLAHVIGGGIALAVVPWQLIRSLRRRVRFHRALGYVYASAVAIGGTAGLVLGPTAWGGPIARIGFTALAVGWLATTAIGVQRIALGDRAGHRRWITRSFALAFAAVSLRIQFPLLATAGVSQDVAYAIVAWSSWVPNLLVAQLLLRRNSAGDIFVHRRNARVNELCSENPSR